MSLKAGMLARRNFVLLAADLCEPRRSKTGKADGQAETTQSIDGMGPAWSPRVAGRHRPNCRR
jgi:hypothetical protein